MMYVSLSTIDDDQWSWAVSRPVPLRDARMQGLDTSHTMATCDGTTYALVVESSGCEVSRRDAQAGIVDALRGRPFQMSAF